MAVGGRAARRQKKFEYYERVKSLFEKYTKVIVVGADNVGSTQMQMIRGALRGRATLLMGKNSMIRRAIRSLCEKDSKLEDLLPLIIGNVGLVFTDEDAGAIRDVILANRVGAPAKAGAIAPVDVIVPPGPTGMEPNMTNFFQALNIATKIARGQIEISAEVHLVHIGSKVTASEAVLLQKLGIHPFSYGLIPTHIYDNGVIFSAAVLDLTSDDIGAMLVAAARDIGAVSLAVGVPTVVSVPHSLLNGFKKIMMISLGSDYCAKEVAELKALLDDPEALAALAATASASAATSAGADAADGGDDDDDSSSMDMGFDMFG